ncbi:hypothetical protein BH09SUM1_BH09SUM1_07870 [soil metagenome]
MWETLKPYATVLTVLVTLVHGAQWWAARRAKKKGAQPAATRPVVQPPSGPWTTCPNKRHPYIRAPRRHNSDQALLAAGGMPLLADQAEISSWLGVRPTHLVWLAEMYGDGWTEKEFKHYVAWLVPKRSGGVRLITAPKPYLRAVQRRILAEILSRATIEANAHGFAKGRSTLTNAKPHAGRGVVVKLDLENFFPTITFRRARGVFGTFGYSEEVSTVLARLCTISVQDAVAVYILAGKKYRGDAPPSRTLPQGAPTSPALSNLVCKRMDTRLAGLAAKFGAVYTRYADDMTFSGDEKFAAQLGNFFEFVRKIISQEGFTINWAKRRIMRKGSRQNVTGIVVNNRPTLARSERKLLRATLHRWKTTGNFDAPADVANKKEWLRGKLSYLSMVDPKSAGPLFAMHDSLRK